MTLQQFQELKIWHSRQGNRHPVERAIWDAVLTMWMIGWVGGATAFILKQGWVELACVSVIFLPGVYVSVRRWLHNKRRLRCDWIVALR
jgi:hypothetical protein